MHLSNQFAMHAKGHIRLYIGPMFASKSSHMANDVERHHIANQPCIIVKHVSDKRYLTKSGGITTHAGYEHTKVLTIVADTLRSVYEEIVQYSVIGIDEIQFFPDSVEVIQELANLGKLLICAGLDGDFKARPFQQVSELIPLAEDVIKLKAICMSCCADASFTKKRTMSENLIEVGGLDTYSAVCRRCMWEEAHNMLDPYL